MNYFVDKFIESIKTIAKDNGIRLILEDSKTVAYPNSGHPVSGYFVDYGNPTLAVAIGKPIEEWIMIFAHESSHMKQFIEKSPYWINSFIDGKEAVDYIDEWIGGKHFEPEFIDDIIKRAIDVELDCEKRTIEIAKKYHLPIKIDEEIKKANSYIWFYTLLKETRKWNSVGRAPYQLKRVWSKFPTTFDNDYSVIPDDIKALYLKLCFNKNEVKSKHNLSVGQEVTWRCELRGGYGRIIFVKAKVVKLNSKKCRIEATAIKRNEQREKVEYLKQVNVDYNNIKESDQYKPIMVCGGKMI